MRNDNKVREVLAQHFDARKADLIVSYFLASAQKFEEGNWEVALTKAGKFVEATVKLLWLYFNKTLPPAKDFKAGRFAEKIIAETSKSLPCDGLRIQIPRACIFVYDVTSNRGARHDSDEVDPNEMDATAILSISSWILSELIRHSAKGNMSPADAKKMVESIMERRYPMFEEIDGRIYVENEKFKSVPECALLILYRKYPKRMSKDELLGTLQRHNCKKTAFKFERLKSYVDIDNSGNILLRAEGRKKVEKNYRIDKIKNDSKKRGCGFRPHPRSSPL